MFLPLILLTQAPAAIGPEAVARFDLKNMPVRSDADRCRDPSGSDIVVCGRRGTADHDHYLRLEPLFRDKPVKAEADLGGGVIAKVTSDSFTFPNGQISKRGLVTLKVPF